MIHFRNPVLKNPIFQNRDYPRFQLPLFRIGGLNHFRMSGSYKDFTLLNCSLLICLVLFPATLLSQPVHATVVQQPVLQQPQLKAKLVQSAVSGRSAQNPALTGNKAVVSSGNFKTKVKSKEPQKPRLIEARMTEPELRAKIIQYVRENMKSILVAKDLQYLKVEIPKIPGMPYILPAKAAPIQVTLTSPLDRFYSDHSIVQIAMQGTGESPLEISVPVSLHIRKPVWIVKNPISAKMPLTSSDFTLEIRDVSANYHYVVGQERPLDDYVARFTMQPGEMLDSRKIVIPPDISYNDNVRIFFTSESGLTMIVPGVALADGHVGQTIRVRQSVFDKRSYNAKILDKDRVLVEM